MEEGWQPPKKIAPGFNVATDLGLVHYLHERIDELNVTLSYPINILAVSVGLPSLEWLR